MLRLAGTEYSLDAQAFDIFVSGCTRNCYNCFNKAEQDFNYGDIIDSKLLSSIADKINSNLAVIKKVRIMGGDLLCHGEDDALSFMLDLLNVIDLPLVLYTGADKENIPEWCFILFSEIKYGKYEDDKHCESKLFGSSNQHYIVKNKMGEWEEIA